MKHGGIENEILIFMKTYGHGGFFFEFLGYGLNEKAIFVFQKNEATCNREFLAYEKIVKFRCSLLDTTVSGAPIIQDGKIVGAVTHVLIQDSTRGYGIFIENMLEH